MGFCHIKSAIFGLKYNYDRKKIRLQQRRNVRVLAKA